VDEPGELDWLSQTTQNVLDTASSLLDEMPEDPEEARKWLEAVAAQDGGLAAQSKKQSSSSTADELPSWLQGVENEQKDALPEWLEQVTSSETPTELETMAKHSEEAAENVIDETLADVQPVRADEWQPLAETAPDTSKTEPSSRQPRGTGMLSRPVGKDAMTATLLEAQQALESGQLDAAMKLYSKIIKKGRLLDEVIFDLREALYRYPVDVIVWQTLGDAYMRANRLQDALDAYTKAEELLR
jgi:tetratricopeptide (TPR) repeat protein